MPSDVRSILHKAGFKLAPLPHEESLVTWRDEKRRGVQGVIGFAVSARITLSLREVVAVLQERLKMWHVPSFLQKDI